MLLASLLGVLMGLVMGLTGAGMPAFPDNLPARHDDAADAWIGMGRIHALARQFEGARHTALIEHGLFGCAHSWLGSRDRRSISSRNSLRSWKRRYTEAKRI